MAVFTFCICCLKCSVLILMLCLCFFKKHTDVKLRAEEKVETSDSCNLFVVLVPEFWDLGFFLSSAIIPQNLFKRDVSTLCPQPGFL